jgi:hypothetical protein
MSKPVATDARGAVLGVGDFVCYTVNTRGSGLSFGHIFKIDEKQVTRYTYDPVTYDRTPYQDIDFIIVVAVTDAFGNTVFETEWDSANRQHVTTTKPTKSGRIAHHKLKFLKL